MIIELDPRVEKIMEALEASGFEAYVVGGAVRDSLLGTTADDVDIATSALPDQTARCLEAIGARTIPTGVQHGTVTALCEGIAVEVTTFRVDGSYSDARHPDSVCFSRNIKEDLARRDFTINAMAYSPERGLIDPFGGAEDIGRRLIRCVGNPIARFTEDALRVLRGLRFASKLGFAIDDETETAMEACATLLDKVSAERIGTEFGGVIDGEGAAETLKEHVAVFEAFIPEIEPLVGYDQHSPSHIYDVWGHTLEALRMQLSHDRATRMATFFHDFGKPLADDPSKQAGRFESHAVESARICRSVLRRLKFPRRFTEECTLAVSLHATWVENNDYEVGRMMGRIGPEAFFRLLDVKRADVAAHGPQVASHVADIDALAARARKLIETGACIDIAGLAIGGRDLLTAGHEAGPAIGETLEALLDHVLRGECPNTREALLDLAGSIAADARPAPEND